MESLTTERIWGWTEILGLLACFFFFMTFGSSTINWVEETLYHKRNYMGINEILGSCVIYILVQSTDLLSKPTIKLHSAYIWKHWTQSGLLSHTARAMIGARVQAHILGFIFLQNWNNRLQISDFSPTPGCFNDSF